MIVAGIFTAYNSWGLIDVICDDWCCAKYLETMSNSVTVTVFLSVAVRMISDLSSRPWRNLPPTCVIHPRGDLQTSPHTPMHMDLGPLIPCFYRISCFRNIIFGSRYDWTTVGPYDGNEWKKYRVVPRAHPSRTLLSAYFN